MPKTNLNYSLATESFQDFFALWKDTDPDIPILKEARAEYAKMQWRQQPASLAYMNN